MKGILTVLLTCLLIFAGCKGDHDKESNQGTSQKLTDTSVQFQGCRNCHLEIKHDETHNLPCIQCHKGNEQGENEQTAHEGLVTQPAHPDFMAESCGNCHPENVNDCQQSIHYTLHDKVRKIREHFGALDDNIKGLSDVSASSYPASATELVDDLLRRRCLRCHLYYSGDTYAKTQRGTGCAACHMSFSNGNLLSHEMVKIPSDLQCLGCHYANYVGADYYGRYEHDFGNEYRTPFTTREEYFRVYGVEHHELVPDIHQLRGLSCVDCHTGHISFNKKDGKKITCKTCHQIDPGNVLPDDSLPINLVFENNTPVLMAKLTGKKHPVPQMIHPAHLKYDSLVSCQVCHAQWSFNDTTTHLMRNDTDDYDPWSSLHTQSSSSVENLLYHNLYSDEDELPPSMPDTITGQALQGVWYKGFTERRWERMLIRHDIDGRIKVFRPILDLRLSYVDSDENVVFDNLQGSNHVLLPYTPHTTGKAGLFYLNRFAHLLKPDNETSKGR